MNKASFLPVFEVGIVNEELPACRQINTASLDPAIVAGMCVSIIDFMVSKLEDHKQLEFEKEILNLFFTHHIKYISLYYRLINIK